jgi:hypothetical protein
MLAAGSCTRRASAVDLAAAAGIAALPAAWDKLTQTNSLGRSNQSVLWVPPGRLSIITQSKADRQTERWAGWRSTVSQCEIGTGEPAAWTHQQHKAMLMLAEGACRGRLRLQYGAAPLRTRHKRQRERCTGSLDAGSG